MELSNIVVFKFLTTECCCGRNWKSAIKLNRRGQIVEPATSCCASVFLIIAEGDRNVAAG